MRFTVAVRRSESLQKHDTAHLVGHHGRPIMLTPVQIVRKPHLLQLGPGRFQFSLPEKL